MIYTVLNIHKNKVWDKTIAMSYALEKKDVDNFMMGIEKTFKDFPKMRVAKSVNDLGKETFTFTMEPFGSVFFIADENGIFQFDKLTGDHQFLLSPAFHTLMKQYTGKDWPSGEVSPSQTDARG